MGAKIFQSKILEFIDSCNSCINYCESCVQICQLEADIINHAKCIELNLYCAEMCKNALIFIKSSSSHNVSFLSKYCMLCAEICEACANENDKKLQIKHCMECAIACRKCAEECLRLKSTELLIH